MLTRSSAPTSVYRNLYSSERKESDDQVAFAKCRNKSVLTVVFSRGLTYRLICSQDPLPVGHNALGNF